MPSTLKRRHRQDLTLRKSFLETLKSKFSSVVTHHRRPRKTSRDHVYAHEPIRAIPAEEITRQNDRPPYHRRPIPCFYTTHSIRILPPELLAYAFILGSEEDSMLPINVSHVCSLWRELALRTPALWRRISLGSHYHQWRERIYRARSCSLDIVLWSPDPTQRSLHPNSTVNFFQVQSYMHIVSPYIRRWRTLDIRLMNYSPYLWNGALSECCSWSGQAQAPLLEDLTLVYRQNDDTKEFCLFSGHAPRLRSATIDGIRLTWLPSLFQNLTFLDYTHHGFNSGYQAIQEIVTLLQVSSRLVHLRLMFPNKMFQGRRSSRGSPIIPQVHLPFLRTLHLRVETRDIPYEFIFLASLLVTPALTSLHLVDITPQRSAFTSIRTFISLYIFPPSLQSISIHYGWYTKEFVTWLMNKLPSLRQLSLKRRDGHIQELDLRRRRV